MELLISLQGNGDNLAVARTIESRFKNWKSALALAGVRKQDLPNQSADKPTEPDSTEVIEG